MPVAAELVLYDIGDPGYYGAVSVDQGVVTVEGDGSGLWSTSDTCHLACNQIDGDATITAYIGSISNAQTYTKTGIMFRESLDANAMNAFVGIRGASQTTFQRRSSTGGGTSETKVSGGVPRWLRLVRSGDDFSAYYSTDGSTWTQVGSTETIAMSDEVYVGLVMDSGLDGEWVSAVYSNIGGLDLDPPNEAPVADAGVDQSLYDDDDSGDQLVSLDGTYSYDTDGSIVSYVWKESGNQIATGATPYATLSVGVHTLTLEVTDDDDATATDTVVITVEQYINIPPVADAGADQNVYDADDSGDQAVTLDATGSSDSDGTIASYAWSEGGTPVAAGATPTVTLSVGVHTLTLVATDDDGDTDSDTVVITVEQYINVAPAADAGADQSVTDSDDDGYQSVTLDGAGSFDSDGVIVSYAWSESGTPVATGATPSVSLAVGSHTLTLTVTDDDGATATDTVTVTVDAAPPATPLVGTDIGDPVTAGSFSIANDALTVNGSDSGLWAGSDECYLVYQLIDGDATVTARMVSIANLQTYTKCGLMFRESLDANAMNAFVGTRGGSQATFQRRTSTGAYTAETRVSGGAPLWLRMVRSGDTFSAYRSTDGSSWTQIGSTETIAMSDEVYVGFVVDSGLDGELVTTVFDNVEGINLEEPNVAPTADAGTDQTVTDSDDDGYHSVALNGAGSSDSDGVIVSYAWSEGGSSIATGATPSVSLAVGSHTLSLTVTDDDGATATDTVTVTVDAAPQFDMTGVDIGSPVIAGSFTETDGVVTVTCGGAGLGGSSDQFHMLYTTLDGDGVITARVSSITNVHSYTKIGVMFRESLDANAMNAFMGIRGGSQVSFQRRTATGGWTSETRANKSLPAYVRIERVGDVFTAYHSSDGVSWTQLGDPATIAMSDEVYVGLASSANSETEATVAVYDNLGGFGASTPNTPPVADAGVDLVTSDYDGDGYASVTLDGSASYDPDGNIVSWVWKESGSQIATGESPQATLATGNHTLTLEVTDNNGGVSSDTVDVSVAAYGNPIPTPQVISEYKSGISLEILGDYGDDYLVEQWYHEPLVDPRCTIYINSDVDFDFFHNLKNCIRTGDQLDSIQVIGVDGLDGIPDSGDEGIIRYRVDQELTTRKMFGDSASLYPAWTGPACFDDLEYDPGISVVGTTGGLPGGDIGDSSTYYWRGMVDSVGDEWHIMAMGDDDTAIASYYANRSSDGKIYYFVVNPTTPACTIVPKALDAQFYTTPPKTYYVPVIRDQVSYVLGNCDIELAALGGAAVQYSMVEEGQNETWQTYNAPINTVVANLQSDTRYELKYRIGATGPVKTRIVHVDPGFPSDGEVHPKNILWKNGETGIQRVRDRLNREPYASHYDDILTSAFIHRRSSPYPTVLYTGERWAGPGGNVLASSIPLLLDGFSQHSDCSAYLKQAMLDTFMNLDPVGLEGIWSLCSPTREINRQGYYGVGTPLGNALAYDMVISDMRAGSHPDGFTAIEDYKIRDNLAAFCNWTCITYRKEDFVDANGFNVGMWNGAWTHGAQIIAAVINNYDSELYGVSGAPGGTYGTPAAWTPFPDHPMTWWDVYNDKYATLYGYPNLGKRSVFWGLLNESEQWADRAPYWSKMGPLYYLSANFRANFDNYHYSHWDTCFKKIAEGGQIMPLKYPQEGPLEHYTAMLINENFPLIAPVEEYKLSLGSSIAEESITYSMWVSGGKGLFLYEDDWDE